MPLDSSEHTLGNDLLLTAGCHLLGVTGSLPYSPSSPLERLWFSRASLFLLPDTAHLLGLSCLHISCSPLLEMLSLQLTVLWILPHCVKAKFIPHLLSLRVRAWILFCNDLTFVKYKYEVFIILSVSFFFEDYFKHILAFLVSCAPINTSALNYVDVLESRPYLRAVLLLS